MTTLNPCFFAPLSHHFLLVLFNYILTLTTNVRFNTFDVNLYSSSFYFLFFGYGLPLSPSNYLYKFLVSLDLTHYLLDEFYTHNYFILIFRWVSFISRRIILFFPMSNQRRRGLCEWWLNPTINVGITWMVKRSLASKIFIVILSFLRRIFLLNLTTRKLIVKVNYKRVCWFMVQPP